MHDCTAPPDPVGAETTIAARNDTVVATVLESFDDLWARAQWVAASDRLVIELAVLDLITVMRAASGRGVTIHLALDVDDTQVGASLTQEGTAVALTGAEFDRRYGLGVRVTYRHTPTASVVHVTHPLRQPARLAAAGAQVRTGGDAADRLDAARPLTKTSHRPNIRICRTGAALPATDPGPPTLTQPLDQPLVLEPARSRARR